MTSTPGRLGNRSVVRRSRPAHPGDSESCPMARGVDHLSQGTRSRIRWSAGSTICPRLLWLGYGCQRCRVHSQATRTHVQKPARSTISPVRLGPWADGPRCRPAVPFFSRPAPITREVDQLSRATRTLLRRPAVYTSTPGRLTHRSMALIVDQLSRDSRAHAWGPAGSTRCPGRPGAVFQWLRG